MDAVSIGSLIAFAVILAVMVALRARNSKFEIKTGDVMVAVLPVALYLLVTGKVKSLQLGDLKVESAIVDASTKSIQSQVVLQKALPVVPVSVASKMSVAQIPQIAGQKTEVLSFTLGYGRYSGSAVETYLSELLRQPYLRYLLILEPSGKFWAMGDPRASFDSDRFAVALNAGDKAELRKLMPLQEVAVRETENKRGVLERMEKGGTVTLPVIDADDRFKGVVDRSRLTASLILDVAAQLKAE